MEKTVDLFNSWNKEKINIDNNDKHNLKVKKRQFWLCKIGVNIGSEISKDNKFIRPVLILNTNYRGDLILVLPLTSSININFKEFYVKIDGKNYGLDKDSYILLNQIKVISKKRLVRKLNDKKNKDNIHIPLLDNKDFLGIVEKVKNNI